MEVRPAELTKVALRDTLLADPHTEGMLPHPALIALDGEAIVILILTDTPDMIILKGAYPSL